MKLKVGAKWEGGVGGWNLKKEVVALEYNVTLIYAIVSKCMI